VEAALLTCLQMDVRFMTRQPAFKLPRYVLSSLCTSPGRNSSYIHSMTSAAGSPSRTLPASAGMTSCGVVLWACPTARHCGSRAEVRSQSVLGCCDLRLAAGDDLTRLLSSTRSLPMLHVSIVTGADCVILGSHISG
jgi:hypothetical protein